VKCNFRYNIFITNSPNFSTCMFILITMHCLLTAAGCHKTKHVVMFRDIRRHNLVRLAEVLHHCDWTDVITESDIDVAYSRFVDSLTTIVQSTIPFRCVTVTNSTPRYITPLVQSLLHQRKSSYIEEKLRLLAIFRLKLVN